MKKSILIVSILSITLYSCKKTEIINSSESTPEVQTSDLNITNYNGNILSFSDRDEFGNLMSDLVTMNDSELLVWENSHSNFISQRKYHEDNGYDLPNEDIVLATVLNKDGIVIIGTKAYLIDIPNDLVYICNEINSSNMALLQNKTLQGELVVAYPTSHEVLYMDEEGWYNPVGIGEVELTIKTDNNSTYKNSNKRGLRCKDKNADKGNDKDAPEYDDGGGKRRMDAKACYQKAGIYFSLMLENKHQRKTNSGFWDREKTEIFYQYIFSFQPKCQAGNGPTSTINYPTNYAKVSFSDKYIYRIYDSMRSLSKYSLKAIFACEKQGGSSVQKGVQYTKELSIAHGY